MVLVWWLTCISCNPVCFKDFSQYYGNLKKLCLNYYSKRSYYKYMVVFATYERGDRKEERGWTDKFFLKPKLSFQISKNEIVFSKNDLKKNFKREIISSRDEFPWKKYIFFKTNSQIIKKEKKNSSRKLVSWKDEFPWKKNSQIIKK